MLKYIKESFSVITSLRVLRVSRWVCSVEAATIRKDIALRSSRLSGQVLFSPTARKKHVLSVEVIIGY